MSAVPLRTPRPRATRPPGRPDLRVVGPVRHRLRYFLLLVGVGGLGVFGVVSLNAMAAQQAFEARALEARVSELSMRYDELTAQVATLESPERVRRVATRQLGMVAPKQVSFLEVEGAATARGRGDDADLAAELLADPIKHVLRGGE